MEAYSLDLRERVIAAVDAQEGTHQEIARRFRVSARWIGKLLKQRQETQSLAPLPHGGGRKAVVGGEIQERLLQHVRQQPDATLAELRQASGIAGSLMCVWRALQRLKITRKKSPCRRPNRNGRTCRPSARPGVSRARPSLRTVSFFSTRATPARR